MYSTKLGNWGLVDKYYYENINQNVLLQILGVGPDSSQQEITSTWRRLSREHHPDKVKEESLRRAAQEKFMEIQQAYEILSNSKHRRNRRNKKDNSEPSKHDEM